MSYLRPVATILGVALVAAHGIVACTQYFEKFDGAGSALSDASVDARLPPSADGAVPVSVPVPNVDGGQDADAGADAAPCTLATTCVATKTTCNATCEQTKTTCDTNCGASNRCKRDCADARDDCVSKCRSTCRTCATGCTQACN